MTKFWVHLGGDKQKKWKAKTSLGMTELSIWVLTHMLLDGATRRDVTDQPPATCQCQYRPPVAISAAWPSDFLTLFPAVPLQLWGKEASQSHTVAPCVGCVGTPPRTPLRGGFNSPSWTGGALSGRLRCPPPQTLCNLWLTGVKGYPFASRWDQLCCASPVPEPPQD